MAIVTMTRRISDKGSTGCADYAADDCPADRPGSDATDDGATHAADDRSVDVAVFTRCGTGAEAHGEN